MTGPQSHRRSRIATAVARALSFAVVAVAAPSDGVWAQRPPADAQPSRGRTPQREIPVFPAKPVIESELVRLDDELAAFLQARPDTAPDAAARLELLIDLRVAARWCYAAAYGEKPESDLQVAAVLRGAELWETARLLAEQFKAAPKPTAQQLDAMSRVHALSYRLPELKQVKQADDVCREIGSLLTTAAGPLPAEIRQIPLMRPSVVAARQDGPAAATRPATPTQDPMTRANALAVSPALKRQVINLLTLAADAQDAARADPKRSPEAASLMPMAMRSLDLAEALARGTAVDPAGRAQLEQRLADGLALFADPRTRPTGQSRLAGLDDYARTIGRIRRLNLRPELQQKLAPAFAWAGSNPEQSARLMGTVETFIQVSAKLDARASAPPVQLPPREAKAVADAIKAATAERDAFLTDAGQMGRPGATATAASLAGRLDVIQQQINSAETYESVPKSLQTLLTFKPRPTGALERRFGVLLNALNDPRPSAAKDDAARAMSEMVRLAELAAELEWPAPVTQDVQSLYTRNKLSAFEARRKEVVAEIASDLAAGKKADAAKLQKLEQMRDLRKALADAVLFEATLKRAEPLSRWVDWRINPADLQLLIGPYRDALSSLFEAYSTDATPPVTFKLVHDRYAPVMKLITRQLPYADPCTGLPAGLAGHLGRLMTPLDQDAFATERYASYAVMIWRGHHEKADTAATDLVVTSLAARAQ